MTAPLADCAGMNRGRLPGVNRKRESALLARAVIGGAARLDEAPDAARPGRVAVAAGAGLAFPVVNPPAMLEIAELAVGLDVVAQAGAAGGDRFVEDVGDGPRQALRPLALDRAGQALGRDAGPEQRFRDIDVAQARDHPLVEQGALMGVRLPASALARLGPSKAGSRGSGPSPARCLCRERASSAASVMNPKRR